MDKLIKKIKSSIPLKSRILFSYLKNINHNPYTLRANFSSITNISDFFIWDQDCYSMGFIAENIRSLLMGHKVDITHNFKFFNPEGELLDHQSFETDEFFKKISFSKINSKCKYISFIHYVESEINIKEILKRKGIRRSLKFCEQNRGYTIYYPNDLISGAIVHGNFGGISKDLKKTAQQTFLKHNYTPIYRFDKDLEYDLVFNNPTSKNLIIEIIFNNSLKTIVLSIPTMGTRFIRIKNYTGSISFSSKLPICRALIFKNPTKNINRNFDVFHS